MFEKYQVKLVKKSNSIFEGLKNKNVIAKKEKTYFKFNFKKATNVGKLYTLPKIHKRLSNVLRYPFICKFVASHKERFGILRPSFPASNGRRETVCKKPIF